jgi:hypothetical protein
MPSTVRRAVATNWSYRLVEREDLRAGLEIYYVEHDRQLDPSVDPKVLAWRIRLDDDPVREVTLGTYVFYHFVFPEPWANQDCFVPLEDFTEQFERRPFDHHDHYWLPMDPAR